MRWTRHVARMGGRGDVHTGFRWGKPEVKRPLGRTNGDWRTVLKGGFKKKLGL
jgi:hypothetical protein